jgi:sec-independent protein translocase protein TatA
MPFLGHWFELLVVLLIGLLVFGPKRMIEMGSSLGKAVRDMRESLKDIPGFGGTGLQSLLGQEEPQRTPFTATSQYPPTPPPAPDPAVSADSVEPAPPSTFASSVSQRNGSSDVVEGSVERVVERPED